MYKKIIFSVIACLCFGKALRAQNTEGFFLQGYEAKKVTTPNSDVKYTTPASAATVSISVKPDKVIARVSKYLYGNNANPYMTDIVSQPDLLNYIKMLSPQILRYPGGNLSNVFFWNAALGHKPGDVPDTILYGDKRKPRPEKFWSGKTDNANTLGLNKYYSVLAKTNSTGIICVNYGYARYGQSQHPVQEAAHLAAQWVRYDQGRTKYWEVGNENYGTWQPGYRIDVSKNYNGQPEYITGNLYGEHFRVFADSMKAAAKQIGADIHVGAVLIETPKEQSWEGAIEKNWNAGFFKTAGNAADFFIVHSYYTPYNKNSSAHDILNTATTETEKIMAYMKQMCADNQVDLKPVALTEWNIFASGSKQMCSFINGIHAAIVLGELAKNKFGMASRWDLANGYNNGNDHGMFSKGDEPGVPLWNPRPAYYYMHYFQKFFGDTMIESEVKGSSNVLAYASRFNSGEVGLVIVNKADTDQIINLSLPSLKLNRRYYVYTLTGGNDNGEFSQKVFVNGKTGKYAAGGPPDVEKIKPLYGLTNGSVKLALPKYAVQYILLGN